MKQNSKKEIMRIGNDKLLSDIKSKPADEATELAESIIDTVREPLLILDKDLRVVKASQSFFDYFKVSPGETIGALIYDLGNQQWKIPKLKELLEKILPEKTTFDNYEVEHDFSTIGKRIMLLNARQIERVFGKEKIILLAIEDITERKHLEESLSETSRMTSEYLDILVNHAHFPIIIWDASFVITRLNNSFEKLSGYDISEVMGKKIDFLFPENKRESTLESLENFLGEENFGITEIDILRKDKEIRTVLWNSANVFDNEGKHIITTIAQDITKRKQTEDALKENEEIFNHFLENSPYYVFFKDKNIRTLRLSANYELLLGKPLNSILGKTMDELFPSELAKKMIEVDKEILNRRKTVVVEEEFNGRYFTTIKFPIIINDEPRYLAGFSIDITERKQAEEALHNSEENMRYILKHDPNAIAVYDNNLNYIAVSDRYLLDYNVTEKNIIGKHHYEVFPEMPQSWKDVHQRCLAGAIERNDNDFFVRPDGSLTYNRWECRPWRRVDGEIGGIITYTEVTTERKKVEMKLQESEERFRKLFENAKIGLYRTTPSGKILMANKLLVKMLGFSSIEKLAGRNLEKDGFDQSYERKEFIEKIEKDGEINDFESVWSRQDGSIFFVRESAKAIRDSHGSTMYYDGVVEDITERKHFEDALRESEEKYRSFFENSIDSILLTIPDGRILSANPAACKMFGFSEQELIGLGKAGIVDITDPQLPILLSERELQGKVRGELKLIRKDGTRFFADISSAIFKDHDGLDRTSMIIRDITVQKHMVDELLKLSSAVEQSPASILITDIQGNIEYANPKVRETTGYQLSELQGQNPRIFGTGGKSAYEYKVLWDTISSGEEWRGEFHNKKKNGELYWESVSISAIKNNIGEIIHYLAVKEDITEKKKMNDELISAKEKAEEMSRLKSNFLANMSHELRTPLVGILGFADIIRQEKVSPDVKVMAETICKSGNRLSETLNLILDLSQLETDKKELKFQKVELVEKTKEVITLFKEAAHKKGLLLEWSFSAESIFLNFDERAYYSILNNLINNAIKFTSEGSVTTSVSQYDHKVEINVTDTGIGIAENDYQSIFDEFRQASEGYSRNFEGTGLGLSITKKFVEKYGGTITVESEVGKGSTFKVILPITNAAKNVKEPIAAGTHSSTKSPEPKSVKPLCLLVDDDPFAFPVMKKYLEDYVELKTTDEAESAAEMLRKKKYDIIFMDINLSQGMDGKEAAAMIRKMDGYESTPIIAITAYAMAGDKEEFLSAGCSHYLSKPFSKTEIIDVVAEAVKW